MVLDAISPFIALCSHSAGAVVNNSSLCQNKIAAAASRLSSALREGKRCLNVRPKGPMQQSFASRNSWIAQSLSPSETFGDMSHCSL